MAHLCQQVANRSAFSAIPAQCRDTQQAHPKHLKHAGAHRRLVCRAAEDWANDGAAPASSSGSSSGSSIPDSLPLAAGSGDWRAFRAALLAAERGDKAAAAAEAGQSGWAHSLPRAEQGCLLLAHPLYFTQHQTYFRNSVILLFSHSSSGSAGIILNLPSIVKVEALKGDESAALPPELGENTLYVGGDVGDSTLHLLHGVKGLMGSVEVMPGVHLGGWEDARCLIEAKQNQPSDFKILYRYAGWGPGQLDEEVERGVWFTAAASADVVHAPAAAAGAEHWHLVMQLMGGETAELSRALQESHNPEIMGLAEESQRRKREAEEEGAVAPEEGGGSGGGDGGDG